MIEVKNKVIASIILKLTQKKNKNLFEKELYESVEKMTTDTVYFDKFEIKPIVSNWLILNSEKQKEALKNNPFLKQFHKDINESFQDLDTKPDTFFSVIYNTYK